jgi:hypothetical protein
MIHILSLILYINLIYHSFVTIHGIHLFNIINFSYFNKPIYNNPLTNEDKMRYLFNYELRNFCIDNVKIKI